jgi:hypothetical protein
MAVPPKPGSFENFSGYSNFLLPLNQVVHISPCFVGLMTMGIARIEEKS